MLRLPRANPSARVVRPRERPGLIVFCRACRRSTPTSQHHVQIHDILYRMYRDILYTPARAERAQEQQRKWPGKGWMSKSNVCDL